MAAPKDWPGCWNSAGFGRAPLEAVRFAPHVFPNGDEFHLRRDDALAGVDQLRHHLAGPGAERTVMRRRRSARFPRYRQARDFLDIAATQDPVAPQRRQAVFGVAVKGLVSPRAAAIVDADRFIGPGFAVEGFGWSQGDLAERNSEIGVEPAGEIYFLGTGRGTVRCGVGSGFCRIHCHLSRRRNARRNVLPFASITWIRFNGSFAQQNSQPAAFGRLAPRTFVTIPGAKAGVKPPPNSPAFRV